MSTGGSAIPTGLVVDPVYREHDPGEGHPESPARYDAVVWGISQAVLPKALLELEPREAAESEIALCHGLGYMERVKRDVEEGRDTLSTGDTGINMRSLDAALMAAGGVIVAVDAVMGGKVANAFCAVRPPGHHATPTCGMGFCIFNNVAIGARYVQREYDLKRVLIVDWDIHHGNGTQEIFYRDPSVFYFSTHQWPFYPGTGAFDDTGIGEGKGTTLNCPFASGSGRAEIVGAFRDKLVPAMKHFKPEFVFISAGFDGRAGDPIGHFVLTDADFEELTRMVLAIADEYAQGRVVSALEGGYDLQGLAAAAGAHVRALVRDRC